MSKVERQTLKDHYLIAAKQEQIKSKRKILHGSPLTGAGVVVVVVVRTVEENEYNMKAFKWLDMMYFSEDATGYFCGSAPSLPHTQKKNNNKKKKKNNMGINNVNRSKTLALIPYQTPYKTAKL